VASLGPIQLILALVVLVCAGLMGRTYYRFAKRRRQIKQALANIALVSLADLRSLALEASRIADERLNLRLRVDDDLEETAGMLDTLLLTADAEQSLSSPDFPLYFALPIGAFIGEALRFHSPAEWSSLSEYGPVLSVRSGTSTTQFYPLHSALMHRLQGKEGELKAEILKIVASQLPKRQSNPQSGQSPQEFAGQS